MSDQIRALLKQTATKDFRALARLLTVLERQGPQVLKLCPELLAPPSAAFRIGITGPPGAGKSTLISQLLGLAREAGLRIGVLAVDPSSPFTNGAVLGDRIRYSEHFQDSEIFIRSLGTRGSLGGLSASTYLMVRAFDWAKFDLVLIETVGVGQTELEIMNVADFVSVVLVPESGDSIQGMKAGLLEIADVFVVNKSDRPGADAYANELKSSLDLSGDSPAQVMMLSALKNQGVREFFAELMSVRTQAGWRQARTAPQRLRAEAIALLREEAERVILQKSAQVETAEDLAKLF